MIYVDTNVLVAFYQLQHEHNAAAQSFIRSQSPGQLATGDHALAEFYRGLTSFAKPHRFSAAEAMNTVLQVSRNLRIVSLDAEEVLLAMHNAARLQITGATIYDAMHVARALKVGAHTIATFNERHFGLCTRGSGVRVVVPGEL